MAFLRDALSAEMNTDPGTNETTEAVAKAPPAPVRKPDETDYRHRHFVNLAAVAFLLVIAVAIIWTVKAMEDNERLQRCFNSGRRDCVKIDVPPSVGIRMPVR